jgi:hypothetical protein
MNPAQCAGECAAARAKGATDLSPVPGLYRLTTNKCPAFWV